MSRATINYRPIIARVPDAIINARRSFRFRNLPTSFRGSENTFFLSFKTILLFRNNSARARAIRSASIRFKFDYFLPPLVRSPLARIARHANRRPCAARHKQTTPPPPTEKKYLRTTYIFFYCSDEWRWEDIYAAGRGRADDTNTAS